jgi:hypothetical protein
LVIKVSVCGKSDGFHRCGRVLDSVDRKLSGLELFDFMAMRDRGV